MTRGIKHLPEQRLLECYLAEERGECLDPPVAEHLADCEACDARYAGIARFMQGLRADAEAEADALFTPERLAAQRQQIARRIGSVRSAGAVKGSGRASGSRPAPGSGGVSTPGTSARVISFPSIQAASRTPRLSRPSRGLVHWIYAAVAAGVVLGIGLGTAYQWNWAGLQNPRRAAGSHLLSSNSGSGRGRRAPGVPIRVYSASMYSASDASDDAFLSDLEVALERPRTRELQPFDTLTPHVREVSDRPQNTWN